MKRAGWRILAVAAMAFMAAAAAAAPIAELSPHRAFYFLSLGNSGSGSGVADLNGGMSVEWSRACDGWIVNQRMAFRVHMDEGSPAEADINFSSWEALDGLSYRFNMRSVRNGKVDEEVRGSATLDGPAQAGRATFTSPPGREFSLPAGALFPVQHSRLLIDRARAGDTSVSRIVFDGAGQDGPQEVNALIGAALPAPPVASVASPLLSRPAWRVRLAIFALDNSNSQPIYETGMRMFDNGVGDDFVFDYGDYSIRGRLSRIEPIQPPGC